MTSFLSELLGQNFKSYKCNDRTVLLLHFKALGQTQAELQIPKFEKVDACIRSLFANLVTYAHLLDLFNFSSCSLKIFMGLKNVN